MINKINIKATYSYLSGKKKILFITTSNRWSQHNDQPKSTALAYQLGKALGEERVKIIEIPLLNIYPCEGNVSSKDGNNCGVKAAMLADKAKNPTGHIRCWASYNNPDDQLYIVANEIFKADAVVFFASVRWGQANAYYQKLIERLDWLENRWSALGETNLLAGKDAGFICVGQNWNDENVTKTQMEVLKFYGFNTPKQLFGFWQYTADALDESLSSYKSAIRAFENTFNINMSKFDSVIKVLRDIFGVKK